MHNSGFVILNHGYTQELYQGGKKTRNFTSRKLLFGQAINSIRVLYFDHRLVAANSTYYYSHFLNKKTGAPRLTRANPQQVPADIDTDIKIDKL